MNAVARLGWIQIDCADPMAQAAFWGEVFGYPVDDDVLGDPPHYAGIVGPDGHPQVSFQRVPEGKVVKNRIHLDVTTDDLEAARARIKELGGDDLEPEDRNQYGYSYRRMTDPEGNEFCLILDEGP